MLWVARDDDGSLGIFQAEPRWFEGEWISGNAGEYVGSLVRRVFPDLAPGECRELRMVEPVDEAREREKFNRWHQSRYGWTWDGDIAPDMGEDERACARWVSWMARADLEQL